MSKKFSFRTDLELPNLVFPYDCKAQSVFLVIGYLGTSPRCLGRFDSYSAAIDCMVDAIIENRFGISSWNVYQVEFFVRCL